VGISQQDHLMHLVVLTTIFFSAKKKSSFFHEAHFFCCKNVSLWFRKLLIFFLHKLYLGEKKKNTAKNVFRCEETLPPDTIAGTFVLSKRKKHEKKKRRLFCIRCVKRKDIRSHTSLKCQISSLVLHLVKQNKMLQKFSVKKLHLCLFRLKVLLFLASFWT